MWTPSKLFRCSYRLKNQLIVFGVAIFVAFLVFASPLVSFASGYTITVSTNKASYPQAVGTPFTVSGSISPAPGVSGTYATIQIKDPSGTLMLIDSPPVDASTGSFSDTLASGSGWPSGVYTVIVSWAASAGGTAYNGTTTFQYGAAQTTTTTGTTSLPTTITTTVTATVTSTSISTTVSTQSTTLTSSTTITSTTTRTNAMWEYIGIAGIAAAVALAGVAAFAMRRS